VLSCRLTSPGALTSEDVDRSFEVLMPAAVMVGRVFKHERHRDAGGLEAVGRDHEVTHCVMLLLDRGEMPVGVIRLVRGGLLKMDHRSAAIFQKLGFLLRYGCQHSWVIGTAVFPLLNRAQLNEQLQGKTHRREIQGGLVAGVEVLMLGSVRDLERAASMPVEPLALDNAKAPAAEDVDGLFAVDVPPGVPADRNLCLQNTVSHSGKPELIRHHQLDLSVLPCTHPWNISVVGNHRRTT